MKMSRTVCIAASVVAIAVTWQVVAPADQRMDAAPVKRAVAPQGAPSRTERDISEDAPGRVQALPGEEIADLRSEVASLGRRIAALEQASSGLPALSVAGSEADAQIERDDPNAEMEALEIAFDEQEQEAEEVSLNRLDRVEAAFLAEVEASAWSAQTADGIEAVLDSPAFAGSEVVDVECRETLCRIEVEHDSVAAEDAFSSVFPGRVASLAPRVLLRVASADGHATSLAYLSRAGYRFP